MRGLLFITQKVDKDDDVLGAYHRWIGELAKRLENISVICLYRGRVELPANVRVFSLGKEANLENGSRKTPRTVLGIWSKRLRYTARFYRNIWRLRKDYDRVFVHMNPEYVILGGPFWKLWNKKIVLWYAHYLANFKLRLAALLADTIVTSTRLAYPLGDKKLIVLQQGIDIGRFRPEPKLETPGSRFKILFLGRIAPVKNLEILLRAVSVARKRHSNICLTVVGAPTPGKGVEFRYFERIKRLVKDLALVDIVKFRLPVPNHLTPKVYNQHDLFVNLTVTGSFDKSTLEAMACGLLALVSNGAFQDILPTDLQELIMYRENDFEDLAEHIITLINQSISRRERIGRRLRRIILDKHSLDELIYRLVAIIGDRRR